MSYVKCDYAELLFILITHVPLPRVLISTRRPYNRKINAPQAAFLVGLSVGLSVGRLPVVGTGLCKIKDHKVLIE